MKNNPLHNQIIDTGKKRHKRTIRDWQWDTIMNSYTGKATINKRTYTVWKSNVESNIWGFIPHEH